MPTRILSFCTLGCLLPFVATSCGPAPPESTKAPTEVSVQVGKVVRTTLHAYLDTYGVVSPEPAASGRPGGAAELAAPLAGLVQEVLVKEGQTVHSGDLVLRLDDRIAQAELDRAQAEERLAEQTLARERRLMKDQNTSQKHLEEAQHALALARADQVAATGELARVQLRAPLDGIVSRIAVFPGQSVDLNTVVAEIVDPDRLVVSAQVSAAELLRLRPGQSARIATAAATEGSVPATVSFVSPSVDPKTGSSLVRLTLPADSGLHPGQFVGVRIQVEERPARLAVPRASLYTALDGRSSLSVVEGGVAHRKEVQVGVEEGGLVEVEGEGIEEGMTVVTVGSYALPDETRVRVLAPEGSE